MPTSIRICMKLWRKIWCMDLAVHWIKIHGNRREMHKSVSSSISCFIVAPAINKHTNIWNTVTPLKCICKYVNRGSDVAVFVAQPERSDGNAVDEIAQHPDGRYSSSNEAIRRILSFPMHERSPVVAHLSAHLENAQRVYFIAATSSQLLPAFFQNDAFAKPRTCHHNDANEEP